MTFNTVYSAAFRDGMFLMVFNPKRNGWEMPGGHIEPGESPEEAAKREFMEESGYSVDVIERREMWDSWGCVCILGDKVAEGEMISQLFSELPEQLAFERAEYEEILEWCRSVLNERSV